MAPLRFLLLGCGGITDAHLPAFLEHPDRLRLVAACDPSTEAAQNVAQRFGEGSSIRCYAESAAAIEVEKSAVDAVLITTPHSLHCPQAKAALEAGLHVLVEKPLCLGLEEARQLLAVEKRSKKALVAGQNRRFDSRVQWLRDWVAASPDHFGDVQSFDLFAFQNIRSWIQAKPNPEADFWILDQRRAGGGVVISLLIHLLDLVRNLTGLDFTLANARGRLERPFKNGAEAMGNGLLTLENGTTGSFHANYLAPRHPRSGEGLTLFGSEGMIRLGEQWEYASAHGRGAPPWGQPDEGLGPVPIQPTSPFQSFTDQLLAFAHSIKNGDRPHNSLSENFNSLAVIEAIYQSMRNDGAPVKVPHI